MVNILDFDSRDESSILSGATIEIFTEEDAILNQIISNNETRFNWF